MQRLEQQVQGSSRIQATLQKMGIRTADDLERYAPIISEIRDPNAFALGLHGQPEPTDLSNLTREGFSDLVGNAVSSELTKQRQAEEDARVAAEVNAAYEAESGFVTELASTMLPESSDGATSLLYEQALNHLVKEAAIAKWTESGGTGPVLALTREGVAEVAAGFKARLDAARGKDMANAARAAAQDQTNPDIAGSIGAQGAPQNDTSSDFGEDGSATDKAIAAAMGL